MLVVQGRHGYLVETDLDKTKHHQILETNTGISIRAVQVGGCPYYIVSRDADVGYRECYLKDSKASLFFQKTISHLRDDLVQTHSVPND